jgi:hypothetical protein
VESWLLGAPSINTSPGEGSSRPLQGLSISSARGAYPEGARGSYLEKAGAPAV